VLLTEREDGWRTERPIAELRKAIGLEKRIVS
jgi:hypothetical protein